MSLGSFVSRSHTQTSETHTKRPGSQRLFQSLRQLRFRAQSHGVRPRNTSLCPSFVDPFLPLRPLLTAVLREAASLSAKPLPGRLGPPRGCSCLPSQPARPCPTLSRAKSPSFPRAQGRSQGSTHQSPIVAGHVFITCFVGISKRFFLQGPESNFGTVTTVTAAVVASSADRMPTDGVSVFQ